jgi:hypothetical protein
MNAPFQFTPRATEEIRGATKEKSSRTKKHTVRERCDSPNVNLERKS